MKRWAAMVAICALVPACGGRVVRDGRVVCIDVEDRGGDVRELGACDDDEGDGGAGGEGGSEGDGGSGGAPGGVQ